MEAQEYLDNFQKKVGEALWTYLKARGVVDERRPECPDVEAAWAGVAQAYIPDGSREFNAYPQVSLGWMMYIGAAVAQMWDVDWAAYEGRDLYALLKEGRGYDELDEYVLEDVLGVGKEDSLVDIVYDCATISHKLLMTEGFEAGTELAFLGYVSALKELYYAGAAVWLKRLGYSMQAVSMANA